MNQLPLPARGSDIRSRSTPRRFPVEPMLLVLLVGVAYFSRAHVLPLRGEEPTRAQIAFEMVHGHDWLVPREQSEPFGLRPPLQNWVIALSCLGFGNWGWFAVRFHSLLATLLITLLIYGYARAFLSRSAALLAGVVFATLPEWFQMGRQAETEALFTLLCGGSLLTWHWGITRDWPQWFTWVIGYFLAALAMLTKGLQAPGYFVGAVVVYLIVTRGWRQLFSAAHLLGILMAVAVVLAWSIPYAHAVGRPDAIRVWFVEASASTSVGFVTTWRWRNLLTHWLTYPVETAAGLLPWSALLLFYFRPNLRRWVHDSPVRSAVIFCTAAIAVAFPTSWLPLGGIPRYFAPLYPCLAVLVAVVLEYLMSAAATVIDRRAWQRFMMAVACLSIVGAIGVSVAPMIAWRFPTLASLTGPLLPSLIYVMIFAALAAVILRFVSRPAAQSVPVVTMAVAASLVTAFIGVGTDIRMRRSENAGPTVKLLKTKLPPNEELVSLNGHTSSLFAYYFGLPIIRPHPAVHSAADAADIHYFCLLVPENERPSLPFTWEEIGWVSMDRNHHIVPEITVVVGRQIR